MNDHFHLSNPLSYQYRILIRMYSFFSFSSHLSFPPDYELLEDGFICICISQCLAHRTCSRNVWLVKESFACRLKTKIYLAIPNYQESGSSPFHLPNFHTDLVPFCSSCLSPCSHLQWYSIPGLFFFRPDSSHPSKFHSKSS